MLSVDINCDMGESFGPWRMGNDVELMKHVSSVNIACGFHAGDATTMRCTVEAAVAAGVAVGAHPGYPDLQGFGRRTMSLSADEIRDIVLYQVSALKGMCEALGMRLHHVKPHGALYNQAASDASISRAIAVAVRLIDPSLVLYGLAGSALIAEAEAAGLRCAEEAFADRTYQAGGSLTPRREPNALVTDAEEAAARALRIVTAGRVAAAETEISIKADTICVHGDGRNSVEIAVATSRLLRENRVTIRAPYL